MGRGKRRGPQPFGGLRGRRAGERFDPSAKRVQMRGGAQIEPAAITVARIQRTPAQQRGEVKRKREGQLRKRRERVDSNTDATPLLDGGKKNKWCTIL